MTRMRPHQKLSEAHRLRNTDIRSNEKNNLSNEFKLERASSNEILKAKTLIDLAKILTQSLASFSANAAVTYHSMGHWGGDTGSSEIERKFFFSSERKKS